MTTTLPELTREDFLAMLRSPDSPENLEWKISPTGLLDADDTGVVTAIVAVTGIVDEVNDIIMPGAFRRTLAQRVPKGVWSHDIHTWVSRTDGVGELMPGDPRLPSSWKGKPWPKDAGAVVVRTAFNLGSRDGADAYSNVKFFDAGPLGPQVEWSIGYNSIPAFTKRRRDGIRELHDIDWYEYGPVLFGAMPLAGTVGTKARVYALEHKGAPVSESTIVGNLGNLEVKVAGKEASPKDVKNTEKLKQYWEHGAGAAKIQWGTPGDFNRCVTELSKYLPPNQVKGYCANRHKGATGGWPGHAPGVEQAEADAKKAAHKSDPAIDDLEGKSADLDPEAQAAALLDDLEGKSKPPAFTNPRRPTRPDQRSDPGIGHAPIHLKRPADLTTEDSIKKAVKAQKRAKDPAKAKAAIKRAAAKVGVPHMIPEGWAGTKDAAIDTLEADGAVDDGGLAEAMEATDAFEALGFSDDEIDAALADDGEFNSVPEDFEPEPAGDGDQGAAAALGISGEHKIARQVSALTVGDQVLELKHADGITSGQVKAMSTRGELVGLGIETKDGLATVWVAGTAECQVAHDPYTELKSGLAMVAERKDYPYLPGSVEERQDEIREAIRDLLLPEPDEQGNVRAYVSLDATFADYVVATLNDYSLPGPDNDQSFVIPYSIGADGEVELGQPAPVEKQVVLVASGGDADDQAAQTDRPTGGMNPSLALARKVLAGAKALVDDLETKAEAGVEDLSGTHVRRLRQADEAIAGAMTGLGLTVAQEGKGADLGDLTNLLARAALV